MQEEIEDTKGVISESVYQRRTDNTMAKRKCTKGQTTIYKIVSVLASKDINREFAPRSGQTEDNAICICCFSTKNAELRRGQRPVASESK